MPEKTHEADSIIVQNIDVDCNFEDEESGYNHSEFFEVKWDGKPHRVAPGETRKFPRYIATHFMKHLTDHIINKLDPDGKKKLWQDKKVRGEIEKKIWIGVDSYVLEQDTKMQSPPPVDAPVVDVRPAPEPVQVESEKPKYTPPPSVKSAAQPVEPPAPVKDYPVDDKGNRIYTLVELRSECDKLDIPYTEKEGKEELQTKIKKEFA